MGCFWMHDWQKWGAPFNVPMMAVRFGEVVGQGMVDQMQRRECCTCGKIQERTL